MKKIVRLTESDMVRLVNKAVNEQTRATGWKEEGEGGYQRPISMDSWIKSLGMNPNIGGQSWTVNGGFGGLVLTLKYSDGKTVKVQI